MATDVMMPQMGESIAEGTITKWMKKVGDTVKRDEPIFEISTDKVDAEIPAPGGGRTWRRSRCPRADRGHQHGRRRDRREPGRGGRARAAAPGAGGGRTSPRASPGQGRVAPSAAQGHEPAGARREGTRRPEDADRGVPRARRSTGNGGARDRRAAPRRRRATRRS